jgi:hypothetical protein
MQSMVTPDTVVRHVRHLTVALRCRGGAQDQQNAEPIAAEAVILCRVSDRSRGESQSPEYWLA